MVAEAGEVGVLLPVEHLLLHVGMVGGFAGLLLLGAQGSVGAEPVQGLLAEAGLFAVVELGPVLALVGGGQGR